MNFALIIFVIAVLGFIFNKRNIILMLISIEVMLLAVTVIILTGSNLHDDILGQLFGIYIISIGGVESAIGLSILLAYYRLRGTITLDS